MSMPQRSIAASTKRRPYDSTPFRSHARSFYAAFPAGHTTASAALQRLNRFQASNRFYAANRELGRTLKTEFLLQYMAEPQLRAKVRRGLLKVEQLHALARAVYYGQRGRISAREVYDQMNACSCLTLDSRLRHLLAGQGDLTDRRRARLPVRPRTAPPHQPNRVEECDPLRRDQNRPHQTQKAQPLRCISTRIWLVPLKGAFRHLRASFSRANTDGRESGDRCSAWDFAPCWTQPPLKTRDQSLECHSALSRDRPEFGGW